MTPSAEMNVTLQLDQNEFHNALADVKRALERLIRVKADAAFGEVPLVRKIELLMNDESVLVMDHRDFPA